MVVVVVVVAMVVVGGGGCFVSGLRVHTAVRAAMYIRCRTNVPKLAFFVAKSAGMLVVHTMVVAMFRGSAVFVWTQAVGM